VQVVTATALQGIEVEYLGARLGDRRLEYRLPKMAAALAAEPTKSLPKAIPVEAALEGAYRLLRNRAVTADGILEGHYEETLKRAAGRRRVIAIHDTTIFEFDGDEEREGLGPLRGKGQGFLGHFVLLAAVDDPVMPLGVLAVDAVVRPKGHKKPADSEKESQRWHRALATARDRLNGQQLVHVMDREADKYHLLAALVDAGDSFVIRAVHDRVICPEICLSDVLATASTVIERTVVLAKRKKKDALSAKQSAREGRTARLAISAVRTSLPRSRGADKSLPDQLPVNIVHVREVDPPPGCEPVDWRLLTSEPIKKPSDLEHIVDVYRARWLIEEFFKAIKTGCDYESRQMESLHTLLNTLALLVPIAWRLLLLRTLARQTPDSPATKALTKAQLAILAKRRYGALPKGATVRQAMMCVARMGGHIRYNGEPGWIVLGRGFHDLVRLEEGWLAAKEDI
jgi:hypothetical protein